MSPLSIGLFTYSTKPRGSVVHAACLAEALGELGHDVTVYALDKDGEGFFRPLRVPLVRVPARPAQAGTDALIAQRIEELATFVVGARPRHHVMRAEDCLVASGLIAARSQLPPALLCRTVHHVEQFESAFLEACQERSVRAADLLLSVSAQTRADLWARYGCAAERVLNGVDSMRFAAGATGAQLRARLGIADGVPLMLSIGGVEPRKNTLRMLDAFVRARACVPDLHWLIAGGASIFEHASYRAAFEQQLAGLAPEVARAVVRIGVLPEADMPALYASCDLLLCTSLQEGFGLCVLEAMASRRPVVVSRGAPFDEYLDERCALFADPHDPDEIAAAIVAALKPAPSRLVAAYERAQSFAWPETAHQHVALYRAGLARAMNEKGDLFYA